MILAALVVVLGGVTFIRYGSTSLLGGSGLPVVDRQDLTRLDPLAKGYLAGITDGRRLYLVGGQLSSGVPSHHGVQAQYDPATGGLTDPAGWAFFDTMTLSPKASGFDAAAFDGRYIYSITSYGCVTRDCLSTGFNGFVARYDTTRPFTARDAWKGFDLTTVSPDLVGFSAAGFDGRHVYFLPSCDNSDSFDCPTHGRLVRYDTQSPFDAKASYAVMDLTTVHSGAQGLLSTAFGSPYLYLVSAYNIRRPGPMYETGKVLVRYDTRSAFTSAESYAVVDVTAISKRAGGYGAAAFDGQYLYLASNGRFVDARRARQEKSGVVARYDPRRPLDDPAAWAFFDLAGLNPVAVGFLGAAFDGRHLYLATYGSQSTQTAVIVRYDTRAPFGEPGSWTVWDRTSDRQLRGPRGIVFLAGHLYTVPNFTGRGWSGGSGFSGVVLQVPTGG